MRWKLLVMMSVLASLVGGALWSALVAALLGPAAVVARHDWLLPLSFIIPFGIAVLAGYFVYRHTARRRKTHALIATLVTLFLIAVAHFAIAHLLPNYFAPRPRVPQVPRVVVPSTLAPQACLFLWS
jgi:branched-subunit amino acid ABC-type transport system permease component